LIVILLSEFVRFTLAKAGFFAYRFCRMTTQIAQSPWWSRGGPAEWRDAQQFELESGKRVARRGRKTDAEKPDKYGWQDSTMVALAG
jgi:hypothetical protein